MKIKCKFSIILVLILLVTSTGISLANGKTPSNCLAPPTECYSSVGDIGTAKLPGSNLAGCDNEALFNKAYENRLGQETSVFPALALVPESLQALEHEAILQELEQPLEQTQLYTITDINTWAESPIFLPLDSEALTDEQIDRIHAIVNGQDEAVEVYFASEENLTDENGFVHDSVFGRREDKLVIILNASFAFKDEDGFKNQMDLAGCQALLHDICEGVLEIPHWQACKKELLLEGLEIYEQQGQYISIRMKQALHRQVLLAKRNGGELKERTLAYLYKIATTRHTSDYLYHFQIRALFYYLVLKGADSINYNELVLGLCNEKRGNCPAETALRLLGNYVDPLSGKGSAEISDVAFQELFISREEREAVLNSFQRLTEDYLLKRWGPRVSSSPGPPTVRASARSI